MNRYEISKKHELENNYGLARELWVVYAKVNNHLDKDRQRANRLLRYRDEDYLWHSKRSKKQVIIALDIVRRHYPEAECLEYYNL